MLTSTSSDMSSFLGSPGDASGIGTGWLGGIAEGGLADGALEAD